MRHPLLVDYWSPSKISSQTLCHPNPAINSFSIWTKLQQHLIYIPSHDWPIQTTPTIIRWPLAVNHPLALTSPSPDSVQLVTSLQTQSIPSSTTSLKYTAYILYINWIKHRKRRRMCDVPFFPIFPICFQCGTDQNPCRCKVVGPTLGMSTIYLSIYLLILLV